MLCSSPLQYAPELDNNFTDFTPKNYSINFRSNENILGLSFQPKLKTPLIKDVFEKTTSGGINGSKDSVSSVSKLFPYAEIKQFSPSQREIDRTINQSYHSSSTFSP